MGTGRRLAALAAIVATAAACSGGGGAAPDSTPAPTGVPPTSDGATTTIDEVAPTTTPETAPPTTVPRFDVGAILADAPMIGLNVTPPTPAGADLPLLPLTALTSAVVRYAGDRTALATVVDGDVLLATATTQGGDPVAGAEIELVPRTLGEAFGTETLRGTVPEGAELAEILIRANFEGAGPGPTRARITSHVHRRRRPGEQGAQRRLRRRPRRMGRRRR